MLRINFICPKCNKSITGSLSSFEYGQEHPNPILLHVHGSESSGVYAIEIECPECGENIDLMN